MMDAADYYNEIPVAVTICDAAGTILYMNRLAAKNFAADGGEALIGKSLLDCHPEPARQKLLHLLESREPNSYTIEKKGIKKMVHQTPWFTDGEFCGLIELSFEIPREVPHFTRG